MLSPMDPNILASQKRQEMLAAFWPRKVSRHLTRILVRTPMTPNQTTVLWGVISVLNCYTVYLAMTDRWWAIPLIPIIFQFAFVLDCVDGEIARYKNLVNPVGGKLLDGICHRATEFALLATFAVAAHISTGSPLALPVGLLLVTADAMYVFVYERRLSVLRQAGFMGHIRQASSEGVYQRGTRWRDLSRKQQIGTITGLLHYKSVYAVVALSYLPPTAFVAGLAAIGIYKHSKWMLLARRTLTRVTALAAEASAVSPSSAPDGAAAQPLVR